MNCKLALKYIMLLADDELCEELKNEVINHMQICSNCKREYEKIIRVNNMLKPEPYLVEIRDEIIRDNNFINTSKRSAYCLSQSKYKQGGLGMKKVMASICVILLVVACTFIPVNGKSIAGEIQDWVNRLTISNVDSNGAVLDVEVVDDLTQEEVEKLDKEFEIYRQSENRTVYASIDEVKAAIGMGFYEPQYIPLGLMSKEILDIYNTQTPNVHNVVLEYTPDGSENNILPETDGVKINSVTVGYSLNSIPKATDNFKSTTRLMPGAIVKEIEISGVKGFMRSTVREGNKIISMNFVLYEVDFTLGGTISADQDSEAASIALEKELIKVAESIINQYK